MGGGPSGPSEAQLRAQREHEAAMMAMQRAMYEQQSKQQQDLLKEQMASAERQRLANEEASRQSAAAAQSAAAQQAAQQNTAQINQQLFGKDTMQKLADEQARKTFQQSLATGAENVTGGYDPNLARSAAMTKLGAASGLLPQTPSNLINAAGAVNPAMTTAGGQQNMFNMPNTTGLVFRGT